jgi:penicillin-binding protein 1B
MARRRTRGRNRPRHKRTRKTIPWFRLLLVLLTVFAGYVAWLDLQVTTQFNGKRWSLPARVYARPLELYAGRVLTPEHFADELRALNYRPVKSVQQAGQYSRNRDTFHVMNRAFTFWDGAEPARSLRVSFSGNTISALEDQGTGKAVSLARLDPVLVGSFYPAHNEDRVLLKLDEVPVSLTNALIAIEDRNFYRHYGVSLQAILRAMWANVRARGVVQGGSTLTQQLVKNFFLTSERSLARKVNEAIMAVLLEIHYSKDEILEAYLNEVYLAQDGQRSVNGFGLASYFYFDRPLSELSVDQYALLIGLVKGPSYYNPWKHPDRARDRRNLVLDTMVKLQLLDPQEAARAKSQRLNIDSTGRKAINTFPAFLDLVRRQLQTDYRDEDITSEGLSIFSTLDPQVQWALEQSLAQRLAEIEASRGSERGKLEGAGLVTSAEGGEVLAVTGGRDPKVAGFNRALDASRQIGSLMKPAVYLTALEQPDRYTLATLLDDGPLTWKARNGDLWEPRNYDKQNHGQVPLYLALAHSYNISTARLGLEVGVDAVIGTLRRMGVEGKLNPYPSLLLGATEMTPLAVTRMYQTFASGGFDTPLRAITAVLAADKTPLQRYPLNVRAAIKPEYAHLITTAMMYVVRTGTGQAIYQVLPADRNVAGKTGTTDDLRDSWFAGFTGDRLGVVWIGRDDNKPTGLTGSTGALRVWRDLFARFDDSNWAQTGSDGIEYHWIDPATGLLADSSCPDAVQLPFITGSAPLQDATCARGRTLPEAVEWFKELIR